jgi:hypothetical protein
MQISSSAHIKWKQRSDENLILIHFDKWYEKREKIDEN